MPWFHGVGQVLYHAFSWLTAGTPVWLSLCVIAACAALAWQFRVMVKRVDRHAKSIAHMDEWADAVDQSLAQIEERNRRFLPAATTTAPRPTGDPKRWWQK